MNHCKTCKHWNIDFPLLVPGFGVCMKIDHGGTFYKIPVISTGINVFLVDGDGSGAQLECDETFGCILHESSGETMIVCNFCGEPKEDLLDLEITIDGQEAGTGHVCSDCQEPFTLVIQRFLRDQYIKAVQGKHDNL